MKLNQKFNIILTDVPWTYRDTANSGKRGAGHKYSLLSLEDICNLKVQNIAADDCVLFFWATWPLMKEAFQVIEAWGFKYRTLGFDWIKMNKVNTSTLFWGMGAAGTRSNSEVCLIATKGKLLERKSKAVHSVVMSPISKHSRKPDEVRKRIVQLYGDLPRVELFATEPEIVNDGWVPVGFDIDGRDIRDVL